MWSIEDGLEPSYSDKRSVYKDSFATLNLMASDYLSEQKLKFKNGGLILILFLVLTLIPYWFLQYYFKFSMVPSLLISLLFVIFLIFGFWLVSYLKYRAVRFKKGISGEAETLQELNLLSPEYKVFKNIKFEGLYGNIDFVVVGPTGIYLIESKKVSGLIDFDGKELLCGGKLLENKHVLYLVRDQYWKLHNYLKDVLKEDIFVLPIIVFVNGNFKKEFGFSPITEQTRVLHLSDLCRFITSQPQYSYKVSVEEVHRVIEKLQQ